MSYQSVGALIITEIVGDFGFKLFAKNGGIGNFIIGVIGYIGVIYSLIVALQSSNILMVNAAWDGMSALIESLAAIIFLGERFGDPWKYLGVVFIVIGLFFLKIPLFERHRFVFPKFW
jgi:multidrug transporter EmrE-like cation transporter